MIFGTFDNITKFGWEYFTGENIMSYIVMGLIIILSFITYFVFKKLDPTKPEKGFAFVMTFFVEKIDSMVEDMMGKKYNGFGGYVTILSMYIGICFFVGILGLPGPMTCLTTTLSIGLCTFLLIHGNAVKANKWGYFQRYIDPIPFLLPINLLSMWSPLLSISLRIFGNAISGYTLMTIVYWALGNIANGIGGVIQSGALAGSTYFFWLPGCVSWILHLYFDYFSGFIQTLIFIMLTMVQVSLEDLDPELA